MTTSSASSTPTSPAASTTANTTASTTGTSSTEPSSAPGDSVPDSTALKVGLGVGIPLASIAAALGTWLLLRRRQAASSHARSEPDIQGTGYDNSQIQAYAYSHPPIVDKPVVAEKQAGPAELETAPVTAKKG